jgi:hypothetical protein
MKKIFFLILIIATLYPNLSVAKVDTKNSNEMFSWCKLWIRQNDGESIGQMNMVKAIGCSWYFKGMFESSLLIGVLDDIKTGKKSTQAKLNGVCAPISITPAQWLRVFVKYLNDNPQHLNRAVSINSASALKKYYRCRK